MKKTFLILILNLNIFSVLAEGGSMSSGGQVSSTVSIQGQSADILYKYSDRMDFVDCYLAHMENGESAVECTLDTYEVYTQPLDILYINGLGAESIFEFMKTANDDVYQEFERGNLSCYKSLIENGQTRIECQLTGVIAETFGIYPKVVQ